MNEQLTDDDEWVSDLQARCLILRFYTRTASSLDLDLYHRT